MAACQRCQEENPDRARFCLACGAPLAPGGAQARKTVTVVFSDLVGSTGLGERLDPESLNQVLTGYFRRARAVLEFHGGTVQKFIGDAVMAVALLDLAEVLRLGGRADQAAAALREAARLFGRKGNRPLAEQAAAALRALPRSGASLPDGGDRRPDAG